MAQVWRVRMARSSSTLNGGSRRCETAWQLEQSGMRSRAGSTMVPGERVETGVVWCTSMNPFAMSP